MKMSRDLETKIDLLAEIVKENRIINLKMKLKDVQNEWLRKQLEQMIKRLENN